MNNRNNIDLIKSSHGVISVMPISLSLSCDTIILNRVQRLTAKTTAVLSRCQYHNNLLDFMWFSSCAISLKGKYFHEVFKSCTNHFQEVLTTVFEALIRYFTKVVSGFSLISDSTEHSLELFLLILQFNCLTWKIFYTNEIAFVI